MWRIWDLDFGMLALVACDEQVARMLLKLASQDVADEMVILGPDDPNPDGSEVPKDVLGDTAIWAFSFEYLEKVMSVSLRYMVEGGDSDEVFN